VRSANRCLVAAILIVHAALLAYLAARHSPTIHEMPHLPAGICHWQFGMFELYRVNPPLPRMVAALPVLFCDPKTDWDNYQLDPLSRETIPMGIRFAKANGARTIFLFMVARWACIPFCLIGGWVCYRWGCELWGTPAGFLALCLWCFNPMLLGHGAVVMPDVPGAAMGVLAAWRYWKWLREPEWITAALAGLTLGLAELCKTTLLVFFVLWPPLYIVQANSIPSASGRVRCLVTERLQLLAICLFAVYVINVGYVFMGSFQRLGDYQFQSMALTGKPASDPPEPGNRFRDTWLGRIPIPLPSDYIQGIDCQRSDFESGERSYLHGRWQERGWWYYYLLGLGIKTPLGTVVALLIAGSITVWGIVRFVKTGVHCFLKGESAFIRPEVRTAAWAFEWQELLLITPGIAILALVSSQSGFSTHVRYAIPALPYLLIWCGKLLETERAALQPWILYCGVQDVNPTDQGKASYGRAWTRTPRLWLAVLCLTVTVLESLSAYPHSISFFSFLIGGPKYGHEWLLDSNAAWGQDLVFLKEWIDRHPEARPLQLANVGWLDPQELGIEFTIPAVGPSRPITESDRLRTAAPTVQTTNDSASAVRGYTGRPRERNAKVPQRWEDVASLADLGPKPGWYAIDVNFLHGTQRLAALPGWWFQTIAEEDLNYEYFRRFEPIDRIAYSYFIFRITPEESERVRTELGLMSLSKTR
jgi:hypothetical protein